MAIPIDTELYEEVKKYVYSIYSKPSAYRSGAVVKLYKQYGGRYIDDGERKLKQWYKSKWTDVSNLQKSHYPVYRPTVRVNKSTPLLVSEIDPKNLKEQIALKQIYKGNKNLPPFKKK